MKEHTCNTYIVKSNDGSNESSAIQSNQDVHVCGCMVDIYMVANLNLLCSLKTYLSIETWKHLLENRGDLIHLFFFSSFFSSGHLSTHCFPYLEHFYVGGSKWKTCFCTYPSCKSSAYVGGVKVILILRAWQTSHKGQQSLTKLNAIISSI
jgi:hypothetical protein